MSDSPNTYIDEGSDFILDILVPYPDNSPRRLSGVGERKALRLTVCVGALWLVCGLLGFFENVGPAKLFIELALSKYNLGGLGSVVAVILEFVAACTALGLAYGILAKIVVRWELVGFACTLMVVGVLAMGSMLYFVSYVTYGIFLSIPISMMCSPLAKQRLQPWPDDLRLVFQMAIKRFGLRALFFGAFLMLGLDWRVALFIGLILINWDLYGDACILCSARLGERDPTGVFAACVTLIYPLAWLLVIFTETRYRVDYWRGKRKGSSKT